MAGLHGVSGRQAFVLRFSQSAAHQFRAADDDLEIGAGRLVRLDPVLLPIPQGAHGYLVARGKFLLAEAERAAGHSNLRCALHAPNGLFHQR